MIYEKMPRTPFSTHLSGSARETEIRIRSIMSGPKKRPPLPFLILAFSLCIFCGNIVSCQVAETDTPAAQDSSASVSAPPDTSEEQPWVPVELKTGMLQYIGQTSDWFYENYSPSEKEMAVLDNLPGAELPWEAVEVYYAMRRDYWRDTLLPVAYDEGEDVTVYFVVNPDSMPNVESLVSPILWGGDLEQQRGIVLRHGERTAYFHLYWGGNGHFASNPTLLADDLDGDGQPEAALVLTDGWGTGVHTESLYIFDLDTMTYTVPDFSDIPLEITASPGETTARMSSGEREWEVDLGKLYEPFKGVAQVGDQVRFKQEDDRLVCDLTLDLSCMSLECLASVHFPVVYEGGGYKLGPATWMGNIL